MFMFLHTCLKFHCHLKKKCFLNQKKSSLIYEPTSLSGPQRIPSHIKLLAHPSPPFLDLPTAFILMKIGSRLLPSPMIISVHSIYAVTEYFLRHFMEAPGFSIIIQQEQLPPYAICSHKATSSHEATCHG